MKKYISLFLLITAIVSLNFAETKDDLAERTAEWFKNNPNSMPHWMTPEELERVGDIGKDFSATSPPTGDIRQTAEFERMQGVFVRYQFGIPMDLIKDLATHTIVYTIVASTSEQNTVINQYVSAGIDTSNCEFMIDPTDSYWTRDYGPWYVVNGDNEVGVCDFMYNRPRYDDDAIPSAAAPYLSEPYYGMSVVHTGGNYMTDGMGIAASTKIVYEESLDQQGITEAEVDQRMLDYLGIHTYHVVDDPNNTYIDHIDCWGKYIDVDKILIREVPISHPQYDEIEATASYFASQISSYGSNYEIYRVNTPNDEPYTNSLIVNDRVYVPVMGTSNDAPTLDVYEAAMPGYTIIPVLNSTGNPWESTDALHCRTRGVVDKEMLNIYHAATVLDQQPGENYEISAEIVSYGGYTIDVSNTNVFYKIDNGSWNSLPMILAKGNYTATIPQQVSGTIVSYYIQSEDNSGRIETHPFIGQADPHQFNVAAQPDITLSQTDTLLFNNSMGSTSNDSFDIGNIDVEDLIYNLSINYKPSKEVKDSGGPDTYGYSWKDSDEPDLDFNWVDITGVGTSLGLGDEDASSAINLGFTFNFYGVDYTSIVVGDNGALTFTGTSIPYQNSHIPSSGAPNSVIAPFWDDLDPSSSTSDDIYYYYDSANSRFIIQYNEIIQYNGSNKNTFEAILYDTGTIVFQYNIMNGPTTSCTVGIENGSGNDGVEVVYNSNYLKNNFAIELKAVIIPEWLSLDPTSGTIVQSGSDPITVTTDATGLEFGSYNADIIITSNDPDESTLILPVKLIVSDALMAPINVIPNGSTNSVALSWDVVGGANLYKIYRSTNPYSGFSEIGTSGTNSYTDNDLLTGNKYFYRVTANN